MGSIFRRKRHLSTRDAVSAAELEQTGGYAYNIFDQNLVDHNKSAQEYINKGMAATGATYEGLAVNMGLEGEAVQAFVQTMDTWNKAVANGTDEEFGRNNGMDDDLSTAPFYAIQIAPGIHHTMGGIKINSDAQVISTSGDVIPGLYAAGETTGGVHGGNRIGGNAVCDFVVFGRIAGLNAEQTSALRRLVDALVRHRLRSETGRHVQLPERVHRRHRGADVGAC